MSQVIGGWRGAGTTADGADRDGDSEGPVTLVEAAVEPTVGPIVVGKVAAAGAGRTEAGVGLQSLGQEVATDEVDRWIGR
jgi:hypothetical protein